MAVYTAKQLLEKHGVKPEQVTSSGVSDAGTQPQEQGLFSRVGNVISNAGQNVREAIRGEGQYAGQSPITRGFQAAGSAALAVPQTIATMAPEPVRKAGEFVGEQVGKGFDVLTDKIASTKLFSDIGNLEAQGFINPQDNPEFYRLKEQLQVAQSSGDIAGSILSAQGTAKTLQTGADVAKVVSKKIANSSAEAFGSLRPTTAEIATERAGKIRKGFEEQNIRLKSADASFNKNTIVRKLPDGTEQKITPIDTFAEHDIAPVIDKGSIQMGDYKTGTGPLGKIKEVVRSLDDEIDTKLVNSGQRISLDDLETQALKSVADSDDFRQAGSVAANQAKVKARFEDYRMSYGDDIDIAELNNIRKVANRDWRPETQDTSRIVGDVARNRVYDAIPDQEIKGLLQKQAELLSAKNYAEKINGSKVTGGRIGNYAMRTAGAVIGSTVDNVPIAGPIAGMLGGEAAARLLQQSQFKSAWTELRSLIAKDGADVVTPKK